MCSASRPSLSTALASSRRARLGDGQARVGAERQQLLFAPESVLQAPELAAGGRDVEEQAAAIGQLDGFLGGLALRICASVSIGGHLLRIPPLARAIPPNLQSAPTCAGLGGPGRAWLGRLIGARICIFWVFWMVWGRLGRVTGGGSALGFEPFLGGIALAQPQRRCSGKALSTPSGTLRLAPGTVSLDSLPAPCATLLVEVYYGDAFHRVAICNP